MPGPTWARAGVCVNPLFLETGSAESLCLKICGPVVLGMSLQETNAVGGERTFFSCT